MTRGGFRGLGYTMACLALVAGCKLGSGSTGADTSAPPPPPPPDPNAAAAGDVVRYGTAEATESGVSYIRQAVAARKAADYASGIVATLYAGTGVQRVARYGNFNLVQFTNNGQVQQGWVDAGIAWRVWDAGVPFDAGVTTAPIGQQPVITTPTPPVTTPTTPATTPTTPPPPATTTPPPPPPPATTNKTPPPPTTKPTTTSTFKPPPPPPKGH